jgi:hypothetical protein
MPDDLYHSDALAWAEQQADLLERLARGERVNEHVDWPNVAREVYRRALVPHGQLRMGGKPPQPQCPFDLDDLLVPSSCVPDIDALLARLSASA